MTNEERETILHALGLNGQKVSYRNHYVTGPGSTDYPVCMALAEAGYMARHDGSMLSGGDYIFTVTDAGRAALDEPASTQ